MITLAALVCFAANSLLCRYALGEGLIDAATFTTVRLVAGALTLVVLMRPSGRPRVVPALALFAYAAFFSFAYNYVTAATGALLLFGAVQATMLLGAMLLGERLSRLQWFGLLVAMSGLAYLLFPGLEAPPVIGASLMLLSGAAWGHLFSSGTERVGGPSLHGGGSACRSGQPGFFFKRARFLRRSSRRGGFRRSHLRSRLRDLVPRPENAERHRGRLGAACRTGDCCRWWSVVSLRGGDDAARHRVGGRALRHRTDITDTH